MTDVETQAPVAKPKQSRLWTIAKIALAMVLLAVVLRQTNGSNVIVILQQASASWMLLCILAFVGSVVCMSIRAWLILDHTIPLDAMVSVTIVQTAIGNLLATSAGLAAYLVALRQQHSTSLGRSAVSLILARLGDLVILNILLCIASIILWAQIQPLHQYLFVLGAITAAGVLFLALVFILRSHLIDTIEVLVERLQITRYRFVQRFLAALRSLNTIEFGMHHKQLAAVIASSTASIACVYFFFYSGLHTFGAVINPWQVLLVLALTQLIAIIPIQVLGGLGVFDLTAVYLFGLFGHNQQELAAVILAMRVVFYLANLVILLYLPFQSWYAGKAIRR